MASSATSASTISEATDDTLDAIAVKPVLILAFDSGALADRCLASERLPAYRHTFIEAEFEVTLAHSQLLLGVVCRRCDRFVSIQA